MPGAGFCHLHCPLPDEGNGVSFQDSSLFRPTSQFCIVLNLQKHLEEGIITEFISPAAIAAIREVPHFRNSHCRNWNLNSLLTSYVHGYVNPILKHKNIDHSTVISDVGTGYGWLAFALALQTPCKIIAVDYDARRLNAAREIQHILGLNDRIEWRVGSLGALPISSNETDIACCIEVIEHVDRSPGTVHDLSRTTRDLLLLTTPNNALPVVFHDTSLPGCHWLPLRLRDIYAKAFGRSEQQGNNLFWSPWRITGSLPEFKRISRFFQYDHFLEWRKLNEFLITNPIGAYNRPHTTMAAYYRLAASLGSASYYVLPNLGSIWRREVTL